MRKEYDDSSDGLTDCFSQGFVVSTSFSGKEWEKCHSGIREESRFEETNGPAVSGNGSILRRSPDVSG